MFELHYCPQCNGNAINYAFPGHTFDYLNCRKGHVWHKANSVQTLSDCPWYDHPVAGRPEWAQHDCGGRMLDSEVGALCENHLNTMRGNPL